MKRVQANLDEKTHALKTFLERLEQQQNDQQMEIQANTETISQLQTALISDLRTEQSNTKKDREKYANDLKKLEERLNDAAKPSDLTLKDAINKLKIEYKTIKDHQAISKMTLDEQGSAIKIMRKQIEEAEHPKQSDLNKLQKDLENLNDEQRRVKKAFEHLEGLLTTRLTALLPVASTGIERRMEVVEQKNSIEAKLEDVKSRLAHLQQTFDSSSNLARVSEQQRSIQHEMELLRGQLLHTSDPNTEVNELQTGLNNLRRDYQITKRGLQEALGELKSLKTLLDSPPPTSVITPVNTNALTAVDKNELLQKINESDQKHENLIGKLHTKQTSDYESMENNLKDTKKKIVPRDDIEKLIDNKYADERAKKQQAVEHFLDQINELKKKLSFLEAQVKKPKPVHTLPFIELLPPLDLVNDTWNQTTSN
ncbi:unnamed protein product [Didymodactylos carnosus]|uniref:Uncharacterized protein n=1 Tax=Didymodactylos carnosus TaxID=1234261 RepID=A0A815B122_9BILA|nr:unnamed protein product [Didymodactylos carnosus]CAF1264194.1 unnamed protein product [Didymodactylos carnosus]CAF3963600.1 unnamed protein product [Didymodactylos carnosus]CAF4045090.1 unnamed protein product [Didymodactylos carnosus]